MLKEFLTTPSGIESECVYLGLPTVHSLEGVGGIQDGTKPFLLNGKIEKESRVGLIYQG